MAKSVSLKLPACETLSLARFWNCSKVHGDLATPITGTSRCARRAIAWSAGKIFLKTRFQLRRKTRARQRAGVSSPGFLGMAAEFEPHRGQEFVAKKISLARRDLANTLAAEECGQASRCPARFRWSIDLSRVIDPGRRSDRDGVLCERSCREIKQPGRDDATRRQTSAISARGKSSGKMALLLAPASAASRTLPRRPVSSRYSNTVVNHLDECPAPAGRNGRTRAQPSVRATRGWACAQWFLDPRASVRYGLQVPTTSRLSADHQAIPRSSPRRRRWSRSRRTQSRGTPNPLHGVCRRNIESCPPSITMSPNSRCAAMSFDRRIRDRTSRHHHPCHSRWTQFRGEIRERSASASTFFFELSHLFG